MWWNKLVYIYVFLWGIYALHWNDMSLPLVEALSNVVLGFCLLMSFLCFLHCCSEYKLSAFLKVSIVLMIVFSIYGIVSIVSGEVLKIKDSGAIIKNGTYIIAFLRSFLPIFAFFYFSKRNVLNSQQLKFFMLFFLVLTVFIYIRSVSLHSLISSKKEFVNNIGYDFLSLVPFVFYLRKTTFQYLYWGVLLCFMFFALKRGPILISSLLLVIFLFNKIKNASSQNKIYTIIGVAIIIGFAFVMLSDYYSSSDLFRTRVAKTLAGNTSKRNVIVEQLLDVFNYDTSLFNYIFGLGADATLKYGINYAHNDWVEILVDQGVFGVFLYLIFWFSAFRHLFFMKDKTSKYVYSFIMLDLFLRTIFSMTYSMIPTVTAMMLGYTIARDEEYRETKEIVIQDD